jgi:membrane associated rhomboid family serine protease
MLKTRWWLTPVIYISAIWIVFGLQQIFPIEEYLALYPRNTNYVMGVYTTVFLHGSFLHLVSNSLPLLGSMLALFYFYKEIAFPVLLINHVGSGILIWLFARPAFHIGASGLVYALVLFLLMSGLVRKNRALSFLALAVLSIQSGLLWGVLPQDNGISWESHLLGGLVGVLTALGFKNKGPKPDVPFQWNEEEEETVIDEYKNFEE